MLQRSLSVILHLLCVGIILHLLLSRVPLPKATQTSTVIKGWNNLLSYLLYYTKLHLSIYLNPCYQSIILPDIGCLREMYLYAATNLFNFQNWPSSYEIFLHIKLLLLMLYISAEPCFCWFSNKQIGTMLPFCVSFYLVIT